MPKSLYSPSWYRVANLKPRLRAHAHIHRQKFRGDTWHLLQDHQNGRYHRLSPEAHLVVCLMDGRRSIQDIWKRVGEKLGEEQPTQDDIVRLLAQLHSADLLIGELPPNMVELSERSEKQSRREMLMRFSNPMAIRIPLFDPDKLLTLTLPFIRPLFTTWGFFGWLLLVTCGIVVGAMNAKALGGNLSDQAFSTQNVVLLLIAYPLVKLFHELGHAYSTKVWGGEVHEVGVMLLLFIPVPYVDASASAAFRKKWRRAVVGGAGIMVEAALAALAVFLWVSIEPGIIRALAFNVILIGGVSTLVFNGNPLLKFDGYYVLSDLIEIPNLATRANKYVLYLIQRYAFGVLDAQSPVTGKGEHRWFVIYAVAAAAYRLSIMMTIALLVAGKFFFVGIALAMISVATTLVMPIMKGVRFVMHSPALQRTRRRAILVSSAFTLAMILLIAAMPVPFATMAQGVLWVGEQSTVRAQSDGFIVDVPVSTETWVTPGTKLVREEDPILAETVTVLKRQLDELQLRLEAATPNDVIQANILREQIRHIEGQLSFGEQRLSDLDITASKAGRFLTMGETDLPGRFLKKGDIVGYVTSQDDPIVRVVVPQNDVDPVRRNTMKVELRFADDMDHVYSSTVLREIPSALAEIPHLALSTTGGGTVVLDPSKTDRPRPLETLFHFDLRVPKEISASRLGGRVYVKFVHQPEPIAYRVVRGVRQLFLKQLGV